MSARYGRYRTDVFSLDGLAGAQREYIDWLLSACSESKDAIGSILTDDAIDLLASKLRTPLQVQLHLSLALEAGYLAGERPVPTAVVESVLSRHINDLEPTLTRNGLPNCEIRCSPRAFPYDQASLANQAVEFRWWQIA